MSGDRLASFRSEVEAIKLGGSVAKMERIGAIVGLVAALVGAIVAIVAYSGAQNAGDFATIYRDQVLGGVGILVAIVGALVWLRNSITRHLRWWMIRNIYEQREQTDRLIEALRDPRPSTNSENV